MGRAGSPRSPQAAAEYWAEVAGHILAQRRPLEPVILMTDVNANPDDPSPADSWQAAAVHHFLRRFGLVDAAKFDAATEEAQPEPTYMQQRAGGGTERRLDITAYSDRVRQAMGIVCRG